MPDTIQLACQPEEGMGSARAGVWERGFAGFSAAVCAGAWCFRHAWGRGISTLVILVLVLLGGLGGEAAVAQEAGPAGQLPLTPPSPAEAMKAYRLVHDWVRAGAAPGAAEGNRAAIAGVGVVLRSRGGIIGRGSEFSDSGDALRAATEEAIGEARRRLNLPNDALAEQRVKEAAAEWSISLELAGPLIPISPATFADCDLELQNGLDGLAARVGGAGGKLAANFPGLMLALGVSPSDALASAISTAAGQPNLAIKVDPKGQPPQIAEARGATYFRFRTTHLAQCGAEAEPIFLFRGGRVVETRDVTAESLGRFAQDLAQRLAGRAGDDGGAVSPLDEPYFSWRGRSAPSADPVLDTTLRHLGILTFAAMPARAGEGPAVAQIRAGAAANAAAFLRARRDGEGSGEGQGRGVTAIYAAGFAALALAATEGPGEGSLWEILEQWPEWERVLAGSYDLEKGWGEKIGEAQRAFIAYGLACRAARGGEEWAARREQAEGAVRSIYRETRPGLLVGHMPWLGWAELALAEGRETVPASAALRDMRDLVWKHQLSDDDVGVDGPDLAGGVVFTAGGNPLPTWQTVRPAAFLATMMGDPRLSDRPEQLREVSRVMATVRFLRQLAVDEAAAYAAADPRTALWGIRASVWDQRQTPEATALTLITVCETLRSLEAIGGRTAPPEKGP